MVILNSDSCCTLVSLDGFDKSHRANDQQSAIDFVRTNIHLPEDDFEDDSDDEDTKHNFAQHLFLPTKGVSVDQYLKSIPQIMETADELLAKPLRKFSVESNERLLYVCQGEVAHTTSKQCDIIASDKSTTCHILTLRSNSAKHGPIVSMAHIDSTSCKSSIRDMVQEHKSSHDRCCNDPLYIDIHILGGFNDKEQFSQELSSFILDQLSLIASEQNDIQMTLKTCVISSINDAGNSYPIGRGMGIHVKTGEIFLAQVDNALKGPLPELRAARLWSNDDKDRLSLIQSTSSKDKFYIQAFLCEAVEQMKLLLELSDDLLLEYTSTSPEVEEDDFCASTRSSLRFIIDMNCERVFRKASSSNFEPAIFHRVQNTNQWIRTQ
mmetsp:Transcript_6224/g.9570  ORF Transcript_6224/g.9570 Transcript_6224/m.9570 type:complete len:380 (+) Transcript_6224:73-1212(+)